MAKLVAHRGASAQATENTIAAFELAIELGTDFVEFDVLQTRDGILIVRHDEWIDGRHISQIDYATIVGDPRFKNVPTLEETLARIAGHVRLYVEIKQPGYEQKVIETLYAHLNSTEFVIISFEDEIISKVKENNPEIRTGLCLVHRNYFTKRLIIRRQDVFHMSRVRATKADFIAPRNIPVLVTSVVNAYRHNIPLYVWTVNSYWAYRILSMLGKVETIGSDVPPHMVPDKLYNHPHRRRLKRILHV